MKEKLAAFISEFDPRLNTFLDKKIQLAREIHPEAPILIEEIKRFVKGGNRVRPLMVSVGYLATGGKERQKILDVGMAVELLHNWALIHDDIIDRSDTRRGQLTSFRQLEKDFAKYRLSGDGQHFGLSQAILAGDLAIFLAEELFAHADFPAVDKQIAGKVWEKVKFEVTLGEALDVHFSFKDEVTEKDIFSVLTYKTAKYTIQRPLQLGASLAGAKGDELRILGEYGDKVGQVFQLQDDILGVFGSEEKTGKSVTSDLIEGKKTLLVLETLRKADSKQTKDLKTVLGNPQATAKQLARAREVIKETGALGNAKKVVRELVSEGIEVLDHGNFTREGKQYLVEVAKYLQSKAEEV